MSSRKLAHLNSVVRQKLGVILQREANDPRFSMVTVTEVQVAKDLSTARVTFSVYDGADKAEELTEALNKAAGFFTSVLGRSLDTRRTPRLHFHYDPGFDHSHEMDLILKNLDDEHS